MVNLESSTRLRPNEVIRRALEYFGPQGLGLEIARRELVKVQFTGGGGEVTVSVLLDTVRGGTTVEVTAQEWERKAEDFLASLPPRRRGLWRRLPLLGRLL